jgi:hypothetical protein
MHAAPSSARRVQELVEEGKYVETEEGWARADADEEEIDIACKAVAYYRCCPLPSASPASWDEAGLDARTQHESC